MEFFEFDECFIAGAQDKVLDEINASVTQGTRCIGWLSRSGAQGSIGQADSCKNAMQTGGIRNVGKLQVQGAKFGGSIR